MYNKNLNKMTKEQLRMQMLAGIITESQYKATLEENKEKDEYYEKLRRDSIDGKGPSMDQVFNYPGAKWKKPKEPSESEKRATARRGVYGVDGILADAYNIGHWGVNGEEGIKSYLETNLKFYKDKLSIDSRKKYAELLKAKERYEELKNSGQLDILKDI